MNTVRQILKVKGNTVWTISKDAPVSQALSIFIEKQIGSVIVAHDDKIEGIFTERDYIQKVSLTGKNPDEVKIEEVMTKEVVTVNPSQSVNVCMTLMTEKRFRHLPVVDQGKLVGIVSIGDILKDIIEELQFMVKQMEGYIKGLR